MTSLSAYIPMDRRLALARQQTLPDRATGSVLLTDMSGFTPLTYSLLRELGHQRGAEELTRQLNFLYERLIADVHRYRGSVISLQGDGFVCWFDGDDGSRATACAMGMRETAKAHNVVVTPGGEHISIALKTAVAAGSARRFVVGHPEIQRMDVLAGSLLDRVAAAEEVLRAGEIVVGAEIMGRLGNDALVAEWRMTTRGEYFARLSDLALHIAPDPWPRPEAVTPPESQTQAPASAPMHTGEKWLLSQVSQRLLRGEEGFLAELRTAVAIFIHFRGIDYDQDDAANVKLHSYVEWVQSVLAHYGGTLLELTMGDKGGYLYAVVGAPTAYEDNVERAMGTALALQTPLPAMRSFVLSTRIGISQGLMRVGSYGSPTRRSYAAQGAEVNLAARLMAEAAPGQILISSHVAKALQTSPRGVRFVLNELDPIEVNGLTEPMAPFSVRSRVGQQLFVPAALGTCSGSIGRTQELATLDGALDGLLAGENRCVIIEGEAGIGKSHLVADLVARAQSRQFGVLQGAGEAVERTTTLHAWRSVFSTLLNISNASESIESMETFPSDFEHGEVLDSKSLRERIRTQLEQHAEILTRLPLLSAVLPIEWPDTELTAQMAGAVRADNTHDLLLHVLRATVGDERLVLIVEDAHWLDSASWQLLLTVQRQVPNLLLVLVARPLAHQSDQVPVPDEFEQLIAEPDTVRLSLQPLTRAEVADLLRQTLRVEHVPSRLLDFVYHQAEGHPLYSQEIAYALRDAGLLRIDGDRCLFLAMPDVLAELNFPNTLNGVIDSRIDRLLPEQQFMLKVASVIGRTFAVDTLHDVHPIAQEQPHIGDHLQTLTHLNVTHMDVSAPELSYLFKHVLTQEVVYNRLLFYQRSRLHRAVAQWFEQRGRADLPVYYPLLAHHWYQAASEELKSESGVASGEAVGDGSGAAIPLLDEIAPIGADESLHKAIHYLEKAAEEAMRNGAYAEVVSFLERAVELATQASTQTADPRAANPKVAGTRYAAPRARWQRLLAEACYGLGRPHASREHFHQALALAGRAMPDSPMALWRSTLRHGLHHLRYRLVGGLRRPRSKESRERRLEAALVYEGLAKLHYYENEMHGAVYAVLRGFNLAVHADAAALRLRFYGNIGMVYTALGLPRWMHLRTERIEALEAELSQDEALASTLAHVLLVSTLWRIGTVPWAALQDRLERALALFEQLRDRRQWGDCLEALGFIHTCSGDFDAALAAYQQLHELGIASDNVEHSTLGLFGQARVQLRLGNWADAEAQLKELLPYIDATPHARLIQHAVLGALAVVYVRQDRFAEATELAAQVHGLLQQMSPLSVFAYEGYVAVAEVSIAQWRHALERDESEPVADSSADDSAMAHYKNEARAAIAGLRKYARIHPIGKPRYWLYQGICAWLQGRPRRAERALQHSLHWAERLDMPYVQAQIHAELAMVKTGNEQRLTHLDQAAALFNHLGVSRFEPSP